MANTFFKSLGESERAHSRTLLHEAIPITGTLVSGTYAESAGTDTVVRGNNIKTFTHGMFQSVYDYPCVSSSANHLFDLTCGIVRKIPNTGSMATSFEGVYEHADQLYERVVTGSGLGQANKRVNIYNQMAQQLLGYDSNGDIRVFDRDGNFNDSDITSDADGRRGAFGRLQQKILDPVFINFSRLLVKDEIKKGSFQFDYGVGRYDKTTALPQGPKGPQIRISDSGAESSYKINSPAGEYGILKASEISGDTIWHIQISNSANGGTGLNVGLIYYQAGIVVLDHSRLHNVGGYNAASPSDDPVGGYIDAQRDMDGLLSVNAAMNLTSSATRYPTDGVALNAPIQNLLASGTINDMCDNYRHRICNIQFNNTTELNSTIYFCRGNHNEFNYSSNPTYLTGSQIRVKGGEYDALPRSYVTTVGMYSADNELLAVAKLSEPLRKDPTNELTLRVRLDY